MKSKGIDWETEVTCKRSLENQVDPIPADLKSLEADQKEPEQKRYWER